MKNPIKLLTILLLSMLPYAAQTSSAHGAGQRTQLKIRFIVEAAAPTVLSGTIVVLPHAAFRELALQVSHDQFYNHSVGTVVGSEDQFGVGTKHTMSDGALSLVEQSRVNTGADLQKYACARSWASAWVLTGGQGGSG
jgi:hypothetical protein